MVCRFADTGTAVPFDGYRAGRRGRHGQGSVQVRRFEEQLEFEEQQQQEQLEQERVEQEEVRAGGDWIPAFPLLAARSPTDANVRECSQ